MKTRALVVLLVSAAAVVIQGYARDSQSQLREPMKRYDRAFKSKDIEAIRSLLAPNVLLYEHSVRNDGLQNVFENHLKPEILEFQGMQTEVSDVRITPGMDLALITRQYKIQGKFQGREINAGGNKTIVWKKLGPDWKVAHMHYSHPCPRPSPARE